MSPPSVERKISTLAALTPFPVVPATFQVTVCVVPAFQVTFVFGALTKKGPAVPLTVITVSSLLLAPPPALLSLTVNLKFNVRATFGTASHCHDVAPDLTVSNLGKYLFESVVGVKDLNAGPEVAVVLGYVVVGVPLFICSHM